MQLTATSLQPAGLPLRSFPHVFILKGHLKEEARIAQGLSEYLERLGHVKAPVIGDRALERRIERKGLPPGSVLVEMQLDLRELVHQQFGAPTQTVCDSLSCYVMPSARRQDVPVLRARLTVIVRDGATMAIRQRARVRALESAVNPRDLRREVTITLIERLRVLVDQRRLLVPVELLAPDVSGVDEAVAAAEAGQWQRAQARYEAIVADQRQAAPAERAALWHDLAQARRFAVEAADPKALAGAIAAMRRALALQPKNGRYREALLDLRRDQRRARTLEAQRAAAAHNFALARKATSQRATSPRPPEAPAPR